MLIDICPYHLIFLDLIYVIISYSEYKLYTDTDYYSELQENLL
jgi:hypothetical protein